MLGDYHILHILAQSNDATAIYDSPELHIRFVNKAMLGLWGKDESIQGLILENAVPELKAQPFIDILKNVWASGETYSGTDTPATLMVDGQPKTSYFDFEYRAIIGDDGKTEAILHTASDVTSRAIAWQEVEARQRRESQLITQLTASETDFKRLVAQAPVAILVFRGKDMVIDLANQAMLEILGKDGSVIGKPLLEGLPELKGQPAVDLLFDVFNTGRPSDGNEVPVRMMRDGVMETRYFNFSYRPLRDEERIAGVMDVAVEVTTQVWARKHLEAIITEKTVLEQTLRANQRRLQGVLDTMAEGVVIVDTDGTPTYANPMSQRIMGVTERQFFNRRYNDDHWKNEWLDGTPLPKDEHPMHRVMQTGKALYDQEIAVCIPSGEKKYIAINAAPLTDDDGHVTGCIITFTDVTNRRKILQQKDDFISVASHELKTPVAALKGSLQLLDRMLPDVSPEMLSKLVTQSNKSLNKLTELVNSLLNSNRVSQGRFPIHKTTFSVASLVNDCCQHVRMAGTHQIILKEGGSLMLTADEQLLDQVIVNFVNNAVKYAIGSTDIIIEAQQLSKDIKVSVTDFGPGIPPDKRPHIFERYYRADHGSVQFSGLGLGLYICSEIIEKHGGKIGVDTGAGPGCTFWFTLPN